MDEALEHIELSERFEYFDQSLERDRRGKYSGTAAIAFLGTFRMRRRVASEHDFPISGQYLPQKFFPVVPKLRYRHAHDMSLGSSSDHMVVYHKKVMERNGRVKIFILIYEGNDLLGGDVFHDDFEFRELLRQSFVHGLESPFLVQLIYLVASVDPLSMHQKRDSELLHDFKRMTV